MERRVMGRQSRAEARQNGCLAAIAAACADSVLAFETMFDPYRPERLYMRGPGLKWNAKHSAACADCR
jgi:hypothetical protein